MRAIRFILAATALPLVLALVACGGGSNKAAEPPAGRSDATSPVVVPAGEPVVLGVSAPLTGPDAPLGIEDRDAVVTAVIRWRAANGGKLMGHDIEVRAEDDGCTDARTTVQAANRLLTQPGLAGVVGPNCSAGAVAALPVYQDAGVVTISGSATQSDLTTTHPPGRYFFRTVYRNDMLGELIGQGVGVVLGARSAYIVDDSEAYGQDLAAGASRAMKDNGVAVSRASITRGTSDFTALAKKIVADKPDFVGFAGFNPEAALLYRQLRDAGYTGLFGSGDAAASVSTFVDPVGAQAAEGVYFAGCPLPLPDDFRRDFVKVHGAEASASTFTAQNADAATVLLDAVAKVAEEQDDGSLVIDPARLRNAVAATHRADGVSGHLAFDEYGDRASNGADVIQRGADLGAAGCQVRGGQLVPVEAQ